jgi:hypothetical protein
VTNAATPRTPRRRNRKVALYTLCAELAACNVNAAHIAALLGSHKGYVTRVMTELGLHRKRKDHSANDAYKRLPPDVCERIEAFRKRTESPKC